MEIDLYFSCNGLFEILKLQTSFHFYLCCRDDTIIWYLFSSVKEKEEFCGMLCVWGLSLMWGVHLIVKNSPYSVMFIRRA